MVVQSLSRLTYLLPGMIKVVVVVTHEEDTRQKCSFRYNVNAYFNLIEVK